MEKNKINSFAISKFLGYELEHNPTNRDIWALIKKVEEIDNGVFNTILKSEYPPHNFQTKSYTFSIVRNQATLYTHTSLSKEFAILECVATFCKDLMVRDMIM